MRRLLRNNSLALVLFTVFFVFLVLQSITGNREYNEDQRAHGEATVGYVEYLGTGHFRKSTFENWESEFLQMGGFVVLTIFMQNWQSEFLAVGSLVVLSIFLRQQGSPESKPVDQPHSETGAD